MIQDIFKQSESGFPNYRATFARIDKTFPIEGADRLVRAIICGRDVVISKDLPLENMYVYIPIETSLSHKYLSKNNLYRVSSDSYQLNDNFDEVTNLLNEGKSFGELSGMGGFFEKSGRVKQIRIRGVYSQGYIADIQSLINAYPILNCYMADEWDELEGWSFDAINDEIFCEKYLVGGKKVVEPKVNDQKHFNQRQKNLKKARGVLIPGQFKYHYDTKQFGDDYKKFSPNDNVTISVKVHGSSGIFGNVRCYKRKDDCNKLQKIFYRLYRPKEYRLLYASRTKIRNEKVYDKPTESNFFYGSDIWGPVRDLLEPFIWKGMIIYGEICGYIEGTTKMIQKGHDYGCRPGEWKFMPYRIVQIKDKKRIEWDLDRVNAWTDSVMCSFIRNGQYEEAHKLTPTTILYQGLLKDLYPDIPIDGDWNLNLLERMKSDTELLGMERQEPLCKMKAPREGVVIRKIGDEVPQAWKLKSAAHYDLEKKSHDSGEHDIEEEF